MSSNGHF